MSSTASPSSPQRLARAPSAADLFTPKLVTVLREGYSIGDLRADLSARVARRVAASIHHDLGRTPAPELPAAVRRHLPETAGMDLS